MDSVPTMAMMKKKKEERLVSGGIKRGRGVKGSKKPLT